jgi:peptidoglycan/LPS O-acetylase OafA/YrhL
MKLGPRADSLDRDNAFDALRLFAALAVIFSHASLVTGTHEPLLGNEDAGHLGVAVFFAISGFLITRSWYIKPEFWQFLGKRALRIMPGLIVVVLATTYILGPLLSSFGARAYLTNPATHGYALANLIFWPRVHLPGVFQDQPAHQVDGPLWTLAVEIRAYLAIALLGITAIFRRHALKVMVVWVALMLIASQVMIASGESGVPWQLVGGPYPAPEYLAIFAVGGCMYLLRDRIQLRGDIALACAAVWLATTPSPQAHHIATVFTVPYLVLCFGYRWGLPCRPITRPGDVSYGMYIWGFPIQQIVAGWSRSPAVNLLIAIPATYLVALASWRLVERPALSMKRRFARPSAPVITPRVQSHPGEIS